MNSFGWGMGGCDLMMGEVVKGWNYGESIGGGVGVGEGYDGVYFMYVYLINM